MSLVTMVALIAGVTGIAQEASPQMPPPVSPQNNPAAVGGAPVADFAAGAAACAGALGERALNYRALEADGWQAGERRGPIIVYSKPGVRVRLFLSTMVAASGQCVVDGYAETEDSFYQIRDAIRSALTAHHGSDVTMPQSQLPNGQAFVYNNLVQILTSERRPGGLSIRITGMRIRN